MNWRTQLILSDLKKRANPANVVGMARFGIKADNALGVSMVELRRLAKGLGHDHALAGELWASGIHEARILAALVDEPERVTSGQMNRWARDFDSWDVCDQVCLNLFSRTASAWTKVWEWSGDRREFVRRAAFALLAVLAVHDRTADDAAFRRALPLIRAAAVDERNYVRKAVNWALRQVGKRNEKLRRAAIKEAGIILKIGTPAARWIARDALRELSAK